MSSWRDAYLKAIEPIRSEKTVETYGLGTKKFEKFLEMQGKNLITAPRQALSQFVVYMIKEGLSPPSVHVYAIAAMMFCRWCKRNGLEMAEMDRPDLPNLKEHQPVVLKEQALAAYVQVCQTVPEPYRSALLLLPLTGLRVSELCKLKLEDVIIDPPWVRFMIRDSKSKADRQVPMLSSGKPMLANYLKNVRPTLKGDLWLFPNRIGGHIHGREVQSFMRKVRAKLGILTLTPHKLRHTYLTILNENGITGFDLAKIAGHKNLKTSALYVHPDMARLSTLVSKVNASWMKGT